MLRTRSRAAVVVALVLAFSVVFPGLMVHGQTPGYPVIVTLSTGETVFIAGHTNDLEGGNWIELSGGTSVRLPSPMILAYEGLISAEYVRDEVTVKIDSSFAEGEATYPIPTHQIFSTGDSITAKFWGESALEGEDVDFRLIRVSSIAEAKDIFTDVFQGDLTLLRDELFRAWSRTETVVGGVATADIIPCSLGNYLLVVVNENFAPYELYVYSATVIEVLSTNLDVTCPSSVDKGDKLNIDTGEESDIRVAVLIKESAYKAEVKLVSDNSVLGTEIYLNDVKMADGAFVIDMLTLSNWDMLVKVLQLQDQLTDAFGSNQIAFDYSSGSLSISTGSLTTGDYVLLVGVVDLSSRSVVGVYEQTVRVVVPYTPSPRPANKPPVADAGPDLKALVNRTVRFDGSGSSDPDGSIMSWSWSFGDGDTASGETVLHKYCDEGTYSVTLTVRDNRGASRSDTCTVTITEPPAPVTDELEELVPGGETGYVVDALAETNTTVTLNTTTPVTITVLRYDGNPHPGDPLPATALPVYADIIVSDPEAVSWPIYVEMHYNDEDLGDLDESTLGIYYWMDGTWQKCSNTGVDTVRNVVWAYMTAMEASGSPILIGGIHEIITPPLPPFLDNLVITPEEVELGEEVTIRFSVENIDNQSFTHIVTMEIEYVNVPSSTWSSYDVTLLIDVELEAYESKTVSRTITVPLAGDYSVTVNGLVGYFTVKLPTAPPTPAEFVVSNLTASPSEVEEGEQVTVSVTVTNIGEMEGSYIVEFKVDGETVESETVTIAGGNQVISIFGLTWSAGTYQVSVEDLTTGFTVSALPEKDQTIFYIVGLIIIVAIVLYVLWRQKLPPFDQAT